MQFDYLTAGGTTPQERLGKSTEGRSALVPGVLDLQGCDLQSTAHGAELQRQRRRAHRRRKRLAVIVLTGQAESIGAFPKNHQVTDVALPLNQS
ncbi:hypothetical protein [Streptomyces sp. 2R]|uniref:hypothetical protein n=1 Tax=Streptomyces sp. 2R TaxID=1883452 RepID=UPI000D1B1E1F|nr:hypothetical protein [Streptomyces sp. 2R]